MISKCQKLLFNIYCNCKIFFFSEKKLFFLGRGRPPIKIGILTLTLQVSLTLCPDWTITVLYHPADQINKFYFCSAWYEFILSPTRRKNPKMHRSGIMIAKKFGPGYVLLKSSFYPLKNYYFKI